MNRSLLLLLQVAATLIQVRSRVPPSCEERRAAELHRLFAEAQRVTGGGVITEAMMARYEERIPTVQRWLVRRVLGKRGVGYILDRCRGESGTITLESALERVDTCISTCTFARALGKFVDWGYADYWI